MFRQFADELRAQIISGELAPGSTRDLRETRNGLDPSQLLQVVVCFASVATTSPPLGVDQAGSPPESSVDVGAATGSRTANFAVAEAALYQAELQAHHLKPGRNQSGTAVPLRCH